MEDGAVLPSWIHKNLATLRQLEWRAAGFGQGLRVAAYRLFTDVSVESGAKKCQQPGARNGTTIGVFAELGSDGDAGEGRSGVVDAEPNILCTPRSTAAAGDRDEAIVESPMKRRRGATGRPGAGARSDATKCRAAPAPPLPDPSSEGWAQIVDPALSHGGASNVENSETRQSLEIRSTSAASLLDATRFLLQRRRALFAQKLGLLHESSCSLSSERIRLTSGRLGTASGSATSPTSGSGASQAAGGEFGPAWLDSGTGSHRTGTEQPTPPTTRARSYPNLNRAGSMNSSTAGSSASGAGPSVRTRRRDSGGSGSGSAVNKPASFSGPIVGVSSSAPAQHCAVGMGGGMIDLDSQSIKSNGSVASESTTATSSGSRNNGAARRSSRRVCAPTASARQSGGLSLRPRSSTGTPDAAGGGPKSSGVPGARVPAATTRRKEFGDCKVEATGSGDSVERSAFQSGAVLTNCGSTTSAEVPEDTTSSTFQASGGGGFGGPVPGRLASAASATSSRSAVLTAGGTANGESAVEVEVAGLFLRSLPQAPANAVGPGTAVAVPSGPGAAQSGVRVTCAVTDLTQPGGTEDSCGSRAASTVAAPPSVASLTKAEGVDDGGAGAAAAPDGSAGSGSGTTAGDWSGFCPKCGKDEFAFEGAENMVACDLCNNWFHFVCVGYVAAAAATPVAAAATNGGAVSRRGFDPRRRATSTASRTQKGASHGSKRPKRSSVYSESCYISDEHGSDSHAGEDHFDDILDESNEHSAAAENIGAPWSTTVAELPKSVSRSRNSKSSSSTRRGSATASGCASVVVVKGQDDDDSWYCPQCLEQLRKAPVSSGSLSTSDRIATRT